MDKDTIAVLDDNKFAKHTKINDIEYDEFITPDEDPVKHRVIENKSLVDPLSITEDENNTAEIQKTETTMKIAKEDGCASKCKILAGNSVLQTKIVSSNNGSGFVKIAPKSTAASALITASSSVATGKTSSGKIIYLQRPGGPSVPVRVPPSIATKSSSGNSSKQAVAIHVIRTTDGTLMPIKSGKNINISNNQLAGKKLIATPIAGKSGNMLIKTPNKTISESASASLTKTTVGSTTISSTDKIKSRMQQLVSSKSVIGNSNGGTSTSNTIIQNLSGNRQIMVPKSMLKLSPSSPGSQLQTIRIPGKPGIQYVRVLNNTAGITPKIIKPEAMKTTTKYTVINQTKPPLKIMIKSPISTDKPKVINTIPTLRKINETVAKPIEADGGFVIQSQKTSMVNSQIQRGRVSNEERSDTSADEFVVNVNKPVIRNTMTSHQKAMQERNITVEVQKMAAQSVPSIRKLYTVLKPDTAHKGNLKARSDVANTKQASVNLANGPTVGHSTRSSPLLAEESAVTIRRKHCNCTKSQCLKLYCDCFANGEFCQDCNCKDCLNNLDNEDERQKAIRICLERNPNSFKPKITVATNESDQRLHNKGCNCKRSGCLKNYCECYEAKIPCSSNCKCIGCRNIEDHPDLDMDIKKGPISAVQTFGRVKRTYDDMVKSRSPTLPTTASSVPALISSSAVTTTNVPNCGPTSEKQPCNFITQEVVDATIQCLIAQADECKKGGLTPYQTEKMIMEELGRCLVEIIDFSIRNTDQN